MHHWGIRKGRATGAGLVVRDLLTLKHRPGFRFLRRLGRMVDEKIFCGLSLSGHIVSAEYALRTLAYWVLRRIGPGMVHLHSSKIDALSWIEKSNSPNALWSAGEAMSIACESETMRSQICVSSDRNHGWALSVFSRFSCSGVNTALIAAREFKAVSTSVSNISVWRLAAFRISASSLAGFRKSW